MQNFGPADKNDIPREHSRQNIKLKIITYSDGYKSHIFYLTSFWDKNI